MESKQIAETEQLPGFQKWAEENRWVLFQERNLFVYKLVPAFGREECDLQYSPNELRDLYCQQTPLQPTQNKEL